MRGRAGTEAGSHVRRAEPARGYGLQRRGADMNAAHSNPQVKLNFTGGRKCLAGSDCLPRDAVLVVAVVADAMAFVPTAGSATPAPWLLYPGAVVVAW